MIKVFIEDDVNFDLTTPVVPGRCYDSALNYIRKVKKMPELNPHRIRIDVHGKEEIILEKGKSCGCETNSNNTCKCK